MNSLIYKIRERDINWHEFKFLNIISAYKLYKSQSK